MHFLKARRSFVPCEDFFRALIWQIGLPDRPAARPSHPPHPHSRPLLLCAARATLSAITALFMLEGLLPNLLLSCRFSPSIGTCAPCSYTGVLVFNSHLIYNFILKRAPAAGGSLSGHIGHVAPRFLFFFFFTPTVTVTCFHSQRCLSYRVFFINSQCLYFEKLLYKNKFCLITM